MPYRPYSYQHNHNADNLGSLNVQGEECPIISLSYNCTSHSYGNMPSTTADLTIMIPSGRCLSFDDGAINHTDKEEIMMLKNFFMYKGITIPEYDKFKSTYNKLEKL